jgi:Peptidase family M23
VIWLALWAPSNGFAYQWPLKPFDRQHPIRGAFGDPRSLRGTVDVTLDNPLSFHSGVDIQAHEGTPVYAVHGGIVSAPNGEAVAIAWPYSGAGASVVFGYWHVVPAVHDGAYVSQSELIGYVRPGVGHLHLSERRFGLYVNPLRRGGLSPYADHTRPVIRGLIVYASRTTHELPLDAVSGRVDVAVDAYDPPAERPWAPWADAIWSPAKIFWSGIYSDPWRPPGGPAQAVNFVRLQTVAVRDVYAPGTRQNGPNLAGDDRFWLVRGLDTTSLVGDRTITVTASDTRGNQTTRALSFTVVG